MHVDAYLDRLDYDRPTAPTFETLGRLQRAHMLAVPFENLDVHLGVPIVLSVPAFYEKIVTGRRGGFCYELNGLFAWLLGQLGFPVTLLSARVASPGGLSPEFDHLALLVETEGRWLADVGFGDSSLDPLGLDSGPEREREANTYSIEEGAGAWTVRRRMPLLESWEPQYVFSLAPRRLEEFAERCLFQQTSPESHFTRNLICSRPTNTGRVTLSGTKLIVTQGERREEREVRGAEELRGLLAAEFGIEIGIEEGERLAMRTRARALLS